MPKSKVKKLADAAVSFRRNHPGMFARYEKQCHYIANVIKGTIEHRIDYRIDKDEDK